MFPDISPINNSLLASRFNVKEDFRWYKADRKVSRNADTLYIKPYPFHQDIFPNG